MKNRHFVFLLPLMALYFSSCQPRDEKEKVEEEIMSLDLSLRDTSVLAVNDFYRHTNGTWLNDTKIPADRSSWGSFAELFEYNEKILAFVLDEVSKGEIYNEDSNEIKAANFYASGMDSLKIAKLGLAPLRPLLDQIEAIANKEDIQSVLSQMHVISAMAFFNEYVGIDDKQTDRYIMNLTQSGLGLPDRDYYFRTDGAGVDVIASYKSYLAQLLVLTGTDSSVASQKAEDIFALETKLAQVSMTRLERRDAEKNYNKISIDDLQALAGWINWKMFFKAIGSPEVMEINVNQLAYITALTEIINQANLTSLKDYLAVKFISTNASYLSHSFVQAKFDFYKTKLSGQEVMRARAKRMVNATNGNLGDALSKLYVNEVFPPEAKKKCLEMVNDIKDAMHKRIDNLAWMSTQTKDQAHKKLTKLKVKIGYPDKWEDYSSIEIKKDTYLQNQWNTNSFANKKNFNKLGQPIDKEEWHMAASVVNAYYNPPANEIVFPAGILQPPFYNYKADAAVNYGGIGAVIGHEITHGFDDQGRKYNHEGKLIDWWTAEDATEFENRAAVMANQYNNFTIQDSLNVNGKLTLGENIADLGGMLIAYDALQLYYKKNGRPEKIDGLTGEQRFFMSQATLWRGKYRAALEQRLLISDPHSPAQFRVNGVMPNMVAFYEAFGVKEGDQLWKVEKDRVNIW